MNNHIHPSASIHPTVEIGPFCVIEPDVAIGEGTRLRGYVELRAGTIIGKRCYIDSGVKMSGDCVIEDDVTIRYDSIIARGVRVGRGTFISPQVMTINLDHHGTAIGGARIGERCHIGTNATLNAGIQIADETTIGAKALVTKDCLEPGIYVGIPARLQEEE